MERKISRDRLKNILSKFDTDWHQEILGEYKVDAQFEDWDPRPMIEKIRLSSLGFLYQPPKPPKLEDDNIYVISVRFYNENDDSEYMVRDSTDDLTEENLDKILRNLIKAAFNKIKIMEL